MITQELFSNSNGYDKFCFIRFQEVGRDKSKLYIEKKQVRKFIPKGISVLSAKITMSSFLRNRVPFG